MTEEGVSPGCIVRRDFERGGRAEIELQAIQATLDFEARGALATDVDRLSDRASAYGLFESPPSNEDAVRVLPRGVRARLPQLCRPMRFGDLTIFSAGSSEAESSPPSPSASSLVLGAEDAFGTGTHATTAMILVRLGQRAPLGSVLDVGTGTGVLGLAALRLGASCAVGTDISSAAVACAQENAARNGLTNRFSSVPHPGPLSDPRGAQRRFGCILANLRAQILIGEAARLSSSLRRDGFLLASGIRFHEEAEVEAAFEAVSLAVSRRLFHDGWWSLEASLS